jgi:hypothetical protein
VAPRIQQEHRRVSRPGASVRHSFGNKDMQPLSTEDASKDSNARQPRVSWALASDLQKNA